MNNQQYGKFSEDGNEYIVTRCDTPKPWLNYLTNGRYTALLSQVAGGHSFYLDLSLNAITPKGLQDAQGGTPGRFIYVRDNSDGEVWNLNVSPIMKEPEAYECRHGFGYSVISSQYRSLAGKTTYFVPTDDDVEIWLMELENKSDKPMDLSLYSYAELCLGDLTCDLLGSGQAHLTKEVTYKNGVLLGTRKSGKLADGTQGHWPYSVYCLSSLLPDGFEAEKEKFIGMYRSVHNPLLVEKNVCSGKNVDGRQSICAFNWNIRLEPGEKKKFNFVMGITPYSDDLRAREDLFEKYKSIAATEEALNKTKQHWRDLLANVTIKTPDELMNLDINKWVKYQLLINGQTWRVSNLYYAVYVSGAGGYRNIIQDAMGMLPLQNPSARENLKFIAGCMTHDGRPAHCTPRPELGAAPEAIGDKSDDSLWLALVVSEYLKETGDWEFLNESIPYIGGKSGPLWEHIIKGVDRVIIDKGSRGLPLIGRGDWNDALNCVGDKGKGESPWLGMFLYYGLRETIKLFDYYLEKSACCKADHIAQIKSQLKKYQEKADELKKAINEFAWNGKYFVRAFGDDGSPVGDESCREGKIYLNPQTWAVISGVTDKDRMSKAMDTADELLGTEVGLSLLSPAYTHYDPKIGIISGFAPGLAENAAVFSHANAFTILAKAMLGRGNDAYKLYKQICAIGKTEEHLRQREYEPFVYCQFAEGPESANFGKGNCSWLTGTAAWVFKGVINWMLGIRPEYDGLLIDPCIPSEWPGYEIEYPFRGATYNIKVKNPQHVQTGVKEIIVDGQKLDSQLIPPHADGKTHNVEVTMFCPALRPDSSPNAS